MNGMLFRHLHDHFSREKTLFRIKVELMTLVDLNFFCSDFVFFVRTEKNLPSIFFQGISAGLQLGRRWGPQSF